MSVDVIAIEDFGAAVKVAAVWDPKQRTRCPVCGQSGLIWGGWFTCDSTGDHIALIETGEVFVRVLVGEKA